MANAFTTSQAVRAGTPLLGLSSAGAQQQSQLVTGLNKSQAEDLLDWLEANGYRNCRVSYKAGEGFTVLYTDG
jgi:hypothetical protein